MGNRMWVWAWIGLFLIGMLPGTVWALENPSDLNHAPLQQPATATAEPAVHRIEHETAAWESVFTLAAGVRRDQLSWTIAGNRNGTDPDVISELKWSDVDSYQLQLSNRTLLAERLYLRAQFGYAWIDDGRVRDSDYSGDHRSGEYSRSISESDDDQLWDVLLGVGSPIFLADRHVMLAPLLGVSLHRQNFRIRNGRQVLTYPGGPPLGSLRGLDSTYQSEWFSPLLGCDLRFFIPPVSGFKRMEAGLEFQWHWDARFEAEADWNLRSDFDHPKSFDQNADGKGVSLCAEWVVWITPQWSVNVTASYQRWETDPGRQRFFLADGRTATTRLNEVDWESNSYMVGVAYQFD